MGCGGFVLEDEVAGAGEGAALGKDVDVGVGGDDFGLRQMFVLLEIALVVGLDVAAIFGGEVFVEDVGVVEVPDAAADGDEREETRGGDEAGSALRSEAHARERQASSAPRRASAMEMTPSTAEDRKPIGDGPEERRHEVAVAVHVRVGVGGVLPKR